MAQPSALANVEVGTEAKPCGHLASVVAAKLEVRPAYQPGDGHCPLEARTAPTYGVQPASPRIWNT